MFHPFFRWENGKYEELKDFAAIDWFNMKAVTLEDFRLLMHLRRAEHPLLCQCLRQEVRTN